VTGVAEGEASLWWLGSVEMDGGLAVERVARKGSEGKRPKEMRRGLQHKGESLAYAPSQNFRVFSLCLGFLGV
ncbi:hypothetical protein OIU85_022589, partial [Salix viminalis]